MILPREKLESLVGEYKSAEDLIKSCERYTLASPTVAVNQMRYAGCHLLDFIKLDDSVENVATGAECIEKAKNHCRRASFDALETLIFSQLEFIAEFQNLCRTKRGVENVYPDYVADYSALADLQERLQAFKMVKSLTSDEKQELIEISEQVTAFKRKILRVKVSVERLESVEATDQVILSVQQFLLSFTATVLGTVLGVAGTMFGVWGMLGCNVWVKLFCVALILCGCAFACKRFYQWAATRLLTEKQRNMLSERFNIKWR